MNSARRLLTVGLVMSGLLFARALPADAAAILIGQTINVALIDNGIDTFPDPPFPDPAPEDLLVVAGQQEITWNNTPFVTNIGSSGLMLDGEFIDVEDLSITFSLFGGGDPHSEDGYLLTGFGPDARYVFSNLFAPGFEIVGVQIVPDPSFTGVAVGSEVFFDAHSVTLMIGTLGIDESPLNLGTIRLNLEVREVDAQPIPEPATLALVGGGALALWRRRRQAKH